MMIRLHLPPLLLPLPRLVARLINHTLQLILFGANDSCLPGQAQHVPLLKYKQNIKNILSHPSVRLHGPTIFLVTPPPIDEIQFEQNQFKDSREQASTAQYAEAIREIASEFKGQRVILIDLWQAVMKKAREWTPGYVDGGALTGTKAKETNEGLRFLLSDGLHLSARGYQVFIEELLPKFGDNWDRETDNEWIFPYWGNLPKAN